MREKPADFIPALYENHVFYGGYLFFVALDKFGTKTKCHWRIKIFRGRHLMSVDIESS